MAGQGRLQLGVRFAASHSVASRSCASQISTLGQADVGDAIFALERLLQRPPSDAVKNQSNAARRWRAVAETVQHAIDATRARSLRVDAVARESASARRRRADRPTPHPAQVNCSSDT